MEAAGQSKVLIHWAFIVTKKCADFNKQFKTTFYNLLTKYSKANAALAVEVLRYLYDCTRSIVLLYCMTFN